MIEVKHANEVDDADYPSGNAIRWAVERADLMKLESDILHSIAKKLNISIPNGQHCELDYLADVSNEMTDLIADCGPFFNGCLANSYSNSVQFCGTICDSLYKLHDNFVKQNEGRPYSFESLNLADSAENCRKYVVETLYMHGSSSILIEVDEDAIYARYVPSIACEEPLLIKFDIADEIAGWICDRMDKSYVQTKKLISELYRIAKRKQLEAERSKGNRYVENKAFA